MPMRIWSGWTKAIGACVLCALAAACGASQPYPGSFPSASGSGNLPSAAARLSQTVEKGDLLYVVGSLDLYVLTYPQGKLVTKVPGAGGSGICSDPKGNVFVTSGAKISEYAHGGTKPVTTLEDPGQSTINCSFDPLTGDLAVTNATGRSSPGSVAVYSGARGSPVLYSDPEIDIYAFCGYDNHGNLFINGEDSSSKFELAELAFGSSSFESITVNRRVGWGVLQWDGSHLTLENQPAPKGVIYRLAISGSNAKIVGTTRLLRWRVNPEVLSWIYGGSVVAPDSPRARKVGFWNYPRGGRPRLVASGFSDKDLLRGVTVSIRPK